MINYSTGGHWMCPGCLRFVSDGSIHNCQGQTPAHHKPLVGGEVADNRYTCGYCQQVVTPGHACQEKKASMGKETHEDIMRSLGQVGGAYQQQPVCAHLTVGYVRQHLGGGSERGWWQCTQCDCKFVPSGTTKA